VQAIEHGLHRLRAHERHVAIEDQHVTGKIGQRALRLLHGVAGAQLRLLHGDGGAPPSAFSSWSRPWPATTT
jgi:hypothetical protein